MAHIISTSINLSAIENAKEKIVKGKKGKYLPITIILNDEKDQFGNDGPVFVQQTEDERKEKAAKVYLGNAKVVWTNQELPANSSEPTDMEDDDLPF